jgi:hypothetical protein
MVVGPSIVKTTHFQTLFFQIKKFPQYHGRYQPWAQILKFRTRPNLYRVYLFDFKIFYINDKKASPICDLKAKVRPPTPPGSETLSRLI